MSFLGRCWGFFAPLVLGAGGRGGVEPVLLYYDDKATALMLVRPVQHGVVSFGAFLLGG